jgi:hypothetical protein
MGEGVSQPADSICSYGNGNDNHYLGTGFFIHRGIRLSVRRVEFVSGRMLFIILRGHWCHMIIFNMHAPSEEVEKL